MDPNPRRSPLPSPVPQVGDVVELLTRRSSDQLKRFPTRRVSDSLKLSAMERGRVHAAEKVRKKIAAEAEEQADPEDAAKAAADRAHGVFLPAEEYVGMVEETDVLRKKVAELEAKLHELEIKSAKDDASLEELQGSGAFSWLQGKRPSVSA